MIAALTWLTGSRTGQILALAMLGVAAVALVIWRVFAAGARSEAAKAAADRAKATIDVLSQKVRTDESLRRLDPVARRDRLREWAAGRG